MDATTNPFSIFTADDAALRVQALALADRYSDLFLKQLPLDVEPITGVLPEGLIHSIDSRYWLRQLRKCQRLKLNYRDAQKIGGGTGAKYSPASVLNLFKESYVRSALFVKSACLSRFRPSTAVDALIRPMGKAVATPLQRYSKNRLFVKGVERLIKDAGLTWFMLTTTLEGPYHANPTEGRNSWNGTTTRQAYDVLQGRWCEFRKILEHQGDRVLGLVVEEPMEDGTPHLHAALFLPQASLESYYDAALAAFGGRLKVITGVKESATAQYYSTGGEYRSCAVDAPARVSASVAFEGKGAASLTSYLTKYLQKNSGVASDAMGLAECSSLMPVLAHRWANGIQGLRFLGLPPGTQTLWDLCRQVDLRDEEDCSKSPENKLPELIRKLVIAAKPKGEGEEKANSPQDVVEFINLLGGLRTAANRLRPAGTKWQEVRLFHSDKKSRYGVTTRTVVGFQLFDCQSVKTERPRKNGKRYTRVEVQRSEAVFEWRKPFSNDLVPSHIDAQALSEIIGDSKKTDLSSIASTPAQRSDLEPLRVLPPFASAVVDAPAGSGKTYSIIQRVKQMLRPSNGATPVSPSEIRVVSFTNPSAKELRSRLDAAGFSTVSCGTLHAAARGHLERACRDVPEDFDQQIRQSTALGGGHFHVLVDEIQDLDSDQIDWLTANAATLFAVGDPSQGLYTWRGADASSLPRLRALVRTHAVSFPNFSLSINRRSAPVVVALGNRISGRSTESIPEQVDFDSLLREPGDGIAPVLSAGAQLVESGSRAAYFAEVVSSVQSVVDASEDASVMVLTRTNAQRADVRVAIAAAGLFHRCQVLTIHAAKGLEADAVVFATGGPSTFARDEDAALENLLYVAVTRAKRSISIVCQGSAEPRLAALIS